MNKWQKVYEAGEAGNLEYLKNAQNSIDFSVNTETLFRAVSNNHIECVAFLLPLSDLRVERGEIVNGSSGLIFQTAVRHNFHDMVKLLLPHCSPQLDNSLALQYASVNCDMNMIDLLYPYSDPDVALADICERIEIGVWKDNAADLLKARMQRDMLLSHTPSVERTSVRKL